MITPRHLKLLRFIAQYQADTRGVSPTYAEMVEAVGLASKSNIEPMLGALEIAGHIRISPRKWRAIEVLAAVEVNRHDLAPHDMARLANPHLKGAVPTPKIS